MKERFDELLPWYVNGTLATEDREWIDAYVAAEPQARAELGWMQSLQSRLQDSAPAVPDTIGLAKTMSRIRAEQPSSFDRLGAWFASLTGSIGMRPLAAMATLAVVVVQGGAILQLLGDAHEREADLRAIQATEVHDRPMLKLNFAPDAKESEIRMLLVSVQGRLAGGPGQLGDYYVIVPSGKEAALAEQLKSNPIVQAVSLAPGLPPRE